MLPKSLVFLMLTIWLVANGLAAQEKNPSFFDIIQTEKMLKMELTVNLDSLLDLKMTNDYLPATLELEDNQGNDRVWQIKVRSRGKFRRRSCEFPPLRLEFDKSDLKDDNLRKFDSYKLVTHCMDNTEALENVFRESLVYQLYQVVEPEKSFRTQLVRVKYQDSGSRKKFTRFGLILEDEKELTDRIDVKECEDCYGMKAEQFDPVVASRNAMFQYMIGNNDWGIETLRNVMILCPKDNTNCLVVPYDFDFSGLVNASYATNMVPVPAGACGGRVYMGFEKSAAELQETIRYYQERREALEKVIWDFRWVDLTSRQKMVEYIEEFYQCIEAGNIVFLDRE